MKKIKYTLLIFCLAFLGCSEDNDVNIETVNITLKFTQNWDGTVISASDFNQFNFTNENGDLISIERLRYVVSNATIGGVEKEYQLINIGENTGSEISLEGVTKGSKSLSFTFGFRDEDNLDGVYADLNSTSFNVPEMLGGGYHYMQFDGKYKDTNNADANFNYHAIRAADITDPDNIILQDTSFEVDLGDVEITENATIEIKMNVAEWFKNPNTWNLNELNTVLMPNFDAQILMSENGQSVFSLGEITSN
jgi:hypothetical protein